MLERVSENTGEPLVLVHGWGCSPIYWRRLSPILEQAGFQLWIATLWGYDQAPLENDGWSFVAASDHLVREIELEVRAPVHLVGHSMGMFVATTLASSHPDKVRSLTMIGIVPDPPSRAGANPAVAELVSEGTVSKETIEVCMEQWYGFENIDAIDKKDLSLALRTVPAHVLVSSAEACIQGLGTGVVDSVRSPILVIIGENDNTRSISDINNFVRSKPDRCLRIIENAGHMPHWTHPESLGDHLLNFISWC